MIDINSFLESSVSSAMETKIIPCPQGEYPGVIEKIGADTWKSSDGLKSGLKLVVNWLIEDQSVKTFLQRDTVSVRQQIFLDIDDNGVLETGIGKNIGLGRLREALGLNQDGVAFTFSMLPGRMAKVVVTHTENKKDPENPFAEVSRVAAAG